MNIGNSLGWDGDRSVGAKVVTGNNDRVDIDVDAEVGIGDEEVFE